MAEIIAFQRNGNGSSGSTVDSVVGRWYTFDPPVEATGWPRFGEDHTGRDMKFNRGRFLRIRGRLHVFEGNPIDDHREISDDLKSCFFHVEFTGGSRMKIDDDQSPN